jgi:hypothetical protein
MQITHPFNSRDVIGCGILPMSRELFFTKNGTYLDSVKLGDRDFSSLHALVGARMSCNLSLNVGQSPFQYSKALDYQIKEFVGSGDFSSTLSGKDLLLEQICAGNNIDGRISSYKSSIDSEYIYSYLIKMLEFNTDHCPAIQNCLLNFGINPNPLLEHNSCLLRHACALERWDVVGLCLDNGCDIEYNGYEASLIASLVIVPSHPILPHLLPPTGSSWSSVAVFKLFQKILFGKIDLYFHTQISLKIAHFLAHHQTLKQATTLVALFGNTEVRQIIELDCIELMQIYLDTRESIAQVFLDKWLALAIERGSSHIAQMLVKGGATLSDNSLFQFNTLVVPSLLQRDGRVMNGGEEVEFYGKKACLVSAFPISMWKGDGQPHYVELYVAEMGAGASVSLGIVTLSSFEGKKMAGTMKNSLGCWRFIYSFSNCVVMDELNREVKVSFL